MSAAVNAPPSPTPPDIILLSRHLSDLPYLEILQHWQGETGSLPAPVLLLTNGLDDELIAQAFAAGVQDILDKSQPTAESLRHMVLAALERFAATQRWQRRQARQILPVNKPAQAPPTSEQASQALQISAVYFRQLADAMPQIVWSTDAAGHLNYVNQRWLAYSGMTLAATLEQGLWPAIHPDDLASNYAIWIHSLQTGEPYESEVRLRRADGIYGWHLERGAPIQDPQGRIIQWFGTSTDIDARKRAELNEQFLVAVGDQFRMLSDPRALITLILSRLRLHLKVDRSIFYILNQTVPANSCPLDWQQTLPNDLANEQLAALVTPTMLAEVQAGHTVLIDATSTVSADVAQLQTQSLLAVPCRHEGCSVAMLMVTAAKPRRWRDDEVVLLETIATRFWPAIESAHATWTVKANEERLRLALQAGDMGTWDWHFAANQITWDEHEYELVGLDPQTTDLQLDTLLAHIHPEDRAAQIYKLNALLEQGEDYQATFRIVRPDGEVRWLGGHGTVIRDDQGQPVRAIGVNYDITAHKHQEIELRALNETLEQRVAERTDELMRRNQELDQFAYIASHDLKAPLRAINNLASWIDEDPNSRLSPTAQEYLLKLRGRIKRMQKLLDDLLTYAQAGRQQDKSESVDTAALVADLIRMLPLPADFRITIEKEMPVLLTQRVPLEMILRNLLDNAIKHHDRTDGNIHVTAHDLKDAVEFSVADDGPGIPEIAHKRIFQMFQTLQPRDKIEGSGMGLAVVKKLIENRGGVITVASGQGRGATFRFIWPKVT
ncbi:MAG: PAS domain-containing protein [Chloroflexi bacterium]|nr:PAS domain-containing protein [Chloroflexota bacterium]